MEILYYFTGWAQTAIGQFHLGVAVLALVLGPIIFFADKGTRSHRVIGIIFIISMLSTNVTALLSYNLTGGFNVFHLAAIFSLGTLLTAIYFIRKAVITNTEKYYIIHGVLMCWTYFGLVAAFVAEIYTRELPYMLHGEGGWTRFALSITLFLSLSSWVVHRLISKLVPKIIRSTNEPIE